LTAACLDLADTNASKLLRKDQVRAALGVRAKGEWARTNAAKCLAKDHVKAA
jgi:hypothetical protein